MFSSWTEAETAFAALESYYESSIREAAEQHGGLYALSATIGKYDSYLSVTLMRGDLGAKHAAAALIARHAGA